MKISKITFLVFLIVTLGKSYQSWFAKQLSLYSKIAYCSEFQIRNWECQTFTQQVVAIEPKEFENTDRNTFGFIAYNPTLKAIVVAFRGSQDINNWMTNLDFIRTSYDACEGCSVHKGFHKAYNDVSQVVRSLVNEYTLKFPESELIITGHSLGGALAALCALDIHTNVQQVDKVYTFGEPRIGNDRFAQFYQTILPNSFRVINYADTVVHTPPKAFGFIHQGIQVWYDPRGMFSYQICDSEDKICANSISTFKFSTSDHSLLKYITLKVDENLSVFERLLQEYLSFFYKLKNIFAMQKYTEQQVETMEVKKLKEALSLKN